MPAAYLLGQVAVDTGWAGQGIGSGLPKRALERCVAAAELVGGRAIMIGEKAADLIMDV